MKMNVRARARAHPEKEWWQASCYLLEESTVNTNDERSASGKKHTPNRRGKRDGPHLFEVR